MQLLKDPVYILCILLLLIIISEWLGQKKGFHHIGASLIVILLAALFANIGVLPSSQNAPPIYNDIFKYIAPLAIFFLLLDVRLKDLKLAGLPMLSMFLVGSIATTAGAIISYYLVRPQYHHVEYANAVAGMYTGTYIGGSANLNAVALQYGVTKNGNLFAAVNAVDNIITTIWIMATLLLPSLLQKLIPRKKVISSHYKENSTEILQQLMSKKETVNILGLAILLFIGITSLLISNVASYYFPKFPSILILTTIALVLAQTSFVQKLSGGKVIGYFMVLLFLAVVGAYCDLHALLQSGQVAITLLLWVSLLVLIHAILLFSIGAIVKQDWDIVSIASNANIGGTVTAGVCANSLGRPDLQLPGILAGAVGNAIGTYAGIFVAEFLK